MRKRLVEMVETTCYVFVSALKRGAVLSSCFLTLSVVLCSYCKGLVEARKRSEQRIKVSRWLSVFDPVIIGLCRKTVH